MMDLTKFKKIIIKIIKNFRSSDSTWYSFMKKYNWKYIISGTKNPKIFMILCEGEREVERYTDVCFAMHSNDSHKDNLENDLKDFVIDQKNKIESSWNNKHYVSKINFIKQSEWTKTQKKFEKKSKQTKF